MPTRRLADPRRSWVRPTVRRALRGGARRRRRLGRASHGLILRISEEPAFDRSPGGLAPGRQMRKVGVTRGVSCGEVRGCGERSFARPNAPCGARIGDRRHRAAVGGHRERRHADRAADVGGGAGGRPRPGRPELEAPPGRSGERASSAGDRPIRPRPGTSGTPTCSSAPTTRGLPPAFPACGSSTCPDQHSDSWSTGVTYQRSAGPRLALEGRERRVRSQRAVRRVRRRHRRRRLPATLRQQRGSRPPGEPRRTGCPSTT